MTEYTSPFPRTMKYMSTGLVVKFTSLRTGTVVSQGSSKNWEIGDTHNNWIDCTDPVWVLAKSKRTKIQKALQKYLRESHG